MNEANLNIDFTWIKEILIKRASDYSTVACVVTSDPERILQLKAYLAVCADYASSNIYVFDPWNGLQQLKHDEEGYLYFERVKRKTEEHAHMIEVESQIPDLTGVIRYISTILQSYRTVFIIEYPDGLRDEEREHQLLLHALRSWAHDTQILFQGSIIVLIVGKFSRVLDEFTIGILKQPPLGDSKERDKIIQDFAAQLKVNLKDTKEALVLSTAGLNLHQLKSALREAYQQKGCFSLEIIKKLKAEFIRRSELLEVEDPDPRGFAIIGGYQKAKNFIRENVIKVIKESERAQQMSLPLPRGLILFGPPGTGKSIFARALSGEINLPFINFRTEILFSKYLGESPQRFRDAIRLAEQMSPAVLFIDEIDKLLARRSAEGASDGASGETRKVVNLVFEWLGSESRKSILVGATNRPGDLDPAAIRPGRIDYMIPFFYPDYEARRQILEVHMGLIGSKSMVPLVMKPEIRNKLLDLLAEKTKDFTGAELENLINRAKRNAFSAKAGAVELEHFIKALENTHIDLVKRKQEKEMYLCQVKEFTSDNDFLNEIVSLYFYSTE